jgi:hypothetical protein
LFISISFRQIKQHAALNPTQYCISIKYRIYFLQAQINILSSQLAETGLACSNAKTKAGKLIQIVIKEVNKKISLSKHSLRHMSENVRAFC